MPRYFFHVRTDSELIEDYEGLELPDAQSAREECSKAMKEILAEEKWQGTSPNPEFHIVDELGRTVAVVPFSS